jgi:hypothetical protein
VSRIGCFAIVMASCCGCCLLRVPTFGFGPEISPEEEAQLRAALLAAPAEVTRLCRADLTCEVVEDVTFEIVPVSVDWLNGQTTVLVAVEARCRASTDPLQRAEPLLCAGVLGAAVASGAAWVTFDTLLPTDPAYVPSSGGGGDFDWD